MTSGQKVAASLLATVVAFVVFIIFVFSGFFSAIETRFYEPAKINDIRKQLDAAADASEIYIENILDKFARGQGAYLNEASVKSYIDSAPSDENVQERTKVTGKLFTDMQGLSGIRIVESNGRNVHFSTYSEDILRQTEMMRMYKDYADLHTPTGTEEIAFDKISAPDNRNAAENYKLTFDGKNNRIIFSLPFYDNYSVYRGTILFYVNSFDFNRALNSQNVAPLQDTCSLVTSDDGEYSGFVFGLPSVGNEILQQEIVRSWRSGSLGPDKIVNINTHGEASDENSSYWLVLTSSKVPYLYLAGVYRDSEFAMLPAVRVLLLVCVLITMFLVVFMIFSIKQDDMVVIRDRIKRFQSAIINEYLDNREKVDWAEMSRQIAGRKYEAAAQIKKSLGKRAEKHEAETNALIDKSWNEILAAIGSGGSVTSSASTDEIKKMLEDIISKGGIKINTSSVVEQPQVMTESPQEIVAAEEELEDVEDIGDDVEELSDDAEEIDSLEEVEPLEEIGADDLLEDVPEELEDVEDIGGDVEELSGGVEDLDSLEEAEPLEEVDTEDLLEDVPEELEEDVDEIVDAVDEQEPFEEIDALEETDAETAPAHVGLLQKATMEMPDVNLQEQNGYENENPSGLLKKISMLDTIDREKDSEKDKHENVSNEPILFTIMPSTPDFSRLDKVAFAGGGHESDYKDTSANEDSAVQKDVSSEIYEVEPLKNNAKPVELSKFEIGAAGVSGELSPYIENVIVQDENGVFKIANNLIYDDDKQNKSFKELVDSVLK